MGPVGGNVALDAIPARCATPAAGRRGRTARSAPILLPARRRCLRGAAAPRAARRHPRPFRHFCARRQSPRCARYRRAGAGCCCSVCIRATCGCGSRAALTACRHVGDGPIVSDIPTMSVRSTGGDAEESSPTGDRRGLRAARDSKPSAARRRRRIGVAVGTRTGSSARRATPGRHRPRPPDATSPPARVRAPTA